MPSEVCGESDPGASALWWALGILTVLGTSHFCLCSSIEFLLCVSVPQCRPDEHCELGCMLECSLGFTIHICNGLHLQTRLRSEVLWGYGFQCMNLKEHTVGCSRQGNMPW